MKTIILICIILFSYSPIAIEAAEKPSHIIKRTSGTIYIDGNASEKDWSAAEPVGDFVFPWYESGKKEQTDVRVLWDDEYLYVLFRCEDENISAEYFQRNSSPFRDDCVEVFIAPNAENPLWYANNEINCLGTWLVGYHKGEINQYVLPERILVGRSHKGTINKEDDRDEYWIIELGIPFESLKNYEGQLPPKDGNIWGINFNRCGGEVNPQYSQWSASKTEKPNFHRPEDFGRLVFSGEKVK
ncbi:carbohydrate-binding family 9-like protein [Candidatus Latescibacterota bacterium]